jgi:transcription antitermination factor NusG
LRELTAVPDICALFDMQRNTHWCVVYTKAQKEDLAEISLRQRGFETFFPQLLLPRSARRKRHIVSMFPNYVFIRLGSLGHDYSPVTWCPGIKRLVSFDGTPATIEDSIMAFLMDQAGPDGIIAARCNVEIGQQISIDGGPFDGLVGIIQEPPTAKGRVKVLLQLLNRPTKVDVPVQFVKASWVAQQPMPISAMG